MTIKKPITLLILSYTFLITTITALYLLQQYDYAFRYLHSKVILSIIPSALSLFALILLFRLKIDRLKKTVLGLLCFPPIALTFISLLTISIFSPDAETNVISPTKKHHIIIRESCFVHCSQKVYLVKYGVLAKYVTDVLKVGETETLLFSKATFSWSADESVLSWIAQGKTGTIKITP